MHAELLTATSLKPQHWTRNSFVLILRHVCLSNSSHHSHTASKDPTHTLANTFSYFRLVRLWNFRFCVKSILHYTITTVKLPLGRAFPPIVLPHHTDGEKECAPHSFTPPYRWGERVCPPLFHPTIQRGRKSVPPNSFTHRTDGEKECASNSFTHRTDREKECAPNSFIHRTDGEKECAPQLFHPPYRWGERVCPPLFTHRTDGEKECAPNSFTHRTDGEKECAPQLFYPPYRWGERVCHSCPVTPCHS